MLIIRNHACLNHNYFMGLLESIHNNSPIPKDLQGRCQQDYASESHASSSLGRIRKAYKILMLPHSLARSKKEGTLEQIAAAVPAIQVSRWTNCKHWLRPARLPQSVPSSQPTSTALTCHDLLMLPLNGKNQARSNSRTDGGGRACNSQAPTGFDCNHSS